MVSLKEAIKLVNDNLKNSQYPAYRTKRAEYAFEFNKGWWIGYPDWMWGGLMFVVKETGQVLLGNPPPLEYIDNKETARNVPDKEFQEAAGY